MRNGRYRLEEPLGGGGQGMVHVARDRVDGRRVVLKWARHFDESIDDERATLLGIEHPCVVNLIDAYHDAAVGTRVLVEPLLEGAHLDAAGLDRDQLASMARDLIDALTLIHRRGLRHGDIKPANIMVVRRDGRPHPILIDFGLCRRADDPELPGATPAFLAPEIGRGGRPSAAMDWWALGASLKRAAATAPEGRGDDELASLIAAMLTADPRGREAQLRDVIDLAGRRADPPRLPTTFPSLADASSRDHALERLLAFARLGRGAVVEVLGDDRAGRGAFLRRLRQDLGERRILAVGRESGFSLAGLMGEILTGQGVPFDRCPASPTEALEALPVEDGTPTVVLFDEVAAASPAGKAFAAALRSAGPLTLPRMPVVLVAARSSPSKGADERVVLGAIGDECVALALSDLLAVEQDDIVRGAARVIAEAGGRASRGIESVIRRSVHEGHLSVVGRIIAFDGPRIARLGASADEGPLDADVSGVLATLTVNGGALDEKTIARLAGFDAARASDAITRAAAAGLVRRGAESGGPIMLETTPETSASSPTWEAFDHEDRLAEAVEPWIESAFPEAVAMAVTRKAAMSGAITPRLAALAVRGLLRANRGDDAVLLLESAPPGDETTLLRARCAMTSGHPEAALTLIEGRLPFAAPGSVALLHARAAHAELAMGRPEKALQRCERVMATDEGAASAEALTLSAVILSDVDPDAARLRFERSLERIADDDHGRAGACLSNQGAFERRQGRSRDAVRLLERAVGRLRHHGDAAQLASALTNLGAALAAEGRFRAAVRAHRRALEAFESGQDSIGSATVRASIAITRYRAGFLAAARIGLREAEAALGPTESAARVALELFHLESFCGRFGRARRRGVEAASRSERAAADVLGVTPAPTTAVAAALRSHHPEDRLHGRAAAVVHASRTGRGIRRRLDTLLTFESRLESGMSPRQKVAFRAATVIPLHEELLERLRVAAAPSVDQTPMLSIFRGVTEAADQTEAFRAVVDGAVTASRAVRAFILRFDAGALEVLARDEGTEARGETPVSSHAIERALLTERATFITDAAADADLGFAPSVQRLGLKSIACIPLSPAAPDTVLYLDSPLEEGAFDSEESRAIVETLGRAAAFALALFVRAASAHEQSVENSLELASKSLEISRLRARMGEGTIPGRSAAIEELNRIVDRIAGSDIPVLVSGETGAGKELVAQAIHARSPRRGGPFIAINCAAVQATLAESELFGHVRGAFSGATTDEPGLLRLADGGTLFLDEIGDMAADLQPKLLRALESGLVRPVGGEEHHAVDIRIVAATLKDARATLREDLYYRIAGITIDIAPLRERREDIAYLARRFLRDAGSKKRFEPQALAALEDYAWPGNVRELRNAVERVAVLALADEVRLTDLPEEIVGYRGSTPRPLADLEHDALAEALRFTAGDKKHAAELLGISRTTLYNKMKRFGM